MGNAKKKAKVKQIRKKTEDRGINIIKYLRIIPTREYIHKGNWCRGTRNQKKGKF